LYLVKICTVWEVIVEALAALESSVKMAIGLRRNENAILNRFKNGVPYDLIE
jgi:hypothetical protein